MAESSNWEKQFEEVYQRGLAALNNGPRTPAAFLNSADKAFLASIGCSTQELFDWVDDADAYGEPDFETALAVQRLRYDYLHQVMGGKLSGQVGYTRDLPAKTADIDGITWLPRIIEKARLKLRGELPADLMYDCGGDRAFLHRVRMTAPDFLRLVWRAGSDERLIVEAVKKSIHAG